MKVFPKIGGAQIIIFIENRKKNQKWTIQINLQHLVHKTQDEDKQNKKHHNTQAITDNVNKTCGLLQTNGGIDEPNGTKTEPK